MKPHVWDCGPVLLLLSGKPCPATQQQQQLKQLERASQMLLECTLVPATILTGSAWGQLRDSNVHRLFIILFQCSFIEDVLAPHMGRW